MKTVRREIVREGDRVVVVGHVSDGFVVPPRFGEPGTGVVPGVRIPLSGLPTAPEQGSTPYERLEGRWSRGVVEVNSRAPVFRPPAFVPVLDEGALREARPDAPAASASILRAAGDEERCLLRSGALLYSGPIVFDDGHALRLVSAADEDVVRRTLRPVYGAALHVVPTPWSGADLEDAVDRVEEAYVSGEGLDELGRLVAFAAVVRVTEGTAAVQESLPAGALRIHPWMRPADR